MTRRLSARRVWALTGVLALAVGATVRWIQASDHRDSALLTANPTEDIADVYSFQSPQNPANIVLAMTVAGFIPPAEAATAAFDPDVLYQLKIDTNADAVEDLVIQGYVTGNAGNQVMHLVGPAKPERTGARTRLLNGHKVTSVRVSTGAEPIVASQLGLTAFAGVRDDPFFFDLVRFKDVIAGHETAFRNPGVDTFAGFNILAIVVEFPKALLGTNGTIGVWGTTSRPQ